MRRFGLLPLILLLTSAPASAQCIVTASGLVAICHSGNGEKIICPVSAGGVVLCPSRPRAQREQPVYNGTGCNPSTRQDSDTGEPCRPDSDD
jgi:hypothetical protein